METKERAKARELVEKFRNHAHADWDERYGYDSIQQIKNAKQCASICVQEILDEKLTWNNKRRDYWQQVLTEIQAI